MKSTSSILPRHFRNSVMLLGIYTLHLLFFQALMAAPVQSEGKVFKPLFINHDKKQRSTRHPAVSYSSILLRQTNSEVPSFVTNPTVAGPFCGFVPHLSRGTLRTYLARIDISHFADDTYKLYRLLHVFLI